LDCGGKCLTNYLPRLASYCDPPNLSLQGARITGVSHHQHLAELIPF
jgi:hypothetical protein